MRILHRVQWAPFVLRDGRIYDVSDVRICDGRVLDYTRDVFRFCEVEISHRTREWDAIEFRHLFYDSILDTRKFDEDEGKMHGQMAELCRAWTLRYLIEHAAPLPLSRCNKAIVVEWRR